MALDKPLEILETYTHCHEFSSSLKQGERYENILDQNFTSQFAIYAVDMTLQRLGIDRIFARNSDGARFSVEYKADSKTAKTNNVFVEIISVDKDNKPGWAYTSIAQALVYYVPDWDKAVISSMIKVRNHLPEWLRTYGTVGVKNPGYYTVGILVPFDVFSQLGTIVYVSDTGKD